MVRSVTRVRPRSATQLSAEQRDVLGLSTRFSVVITRSEAGCGKTLLVLTVMKLLGAKGVTYMQGNAIQIGGQTVYSLLRVSPFSMDILSDVTKNARDGVCDHLRSLQVAVFDELQTIDVRLLEICLTVIRAFATSIQRVYGFGDALQTPAVALDAGLVKDHMGNHVVDDAGQVTQPPPIIGCELSG